MHERGCSGVKVHLKSHLSRKTFYLERIYLGKDLDINWIFDKITLSCSVGLTTGLLARGHHSKSEMGTASEKGVWKNRIK